MNRETTAVHTTSGRWVYGLMLTLVTCFMWGTLPIAMKILLADLDPFTVCFYRFALSGICLWPFLASRRQLPPASLIKNPRLLLWVAVCALLLVGNNGFYILALARMSPAAAQVLIQLATVLFLLSGVIFFHERFSSRQWLGCLVFLLGLGVFFYPRIIAMLTGFDAYAIGMGLMLISAVCWSTYAVLQKQLQAGFSSAQIMLLIYLIGSLGFLPLAHPTEIIKLDLVGVLLLLFCGASTLIGSGSFSEALTHWEASRIAAVLTTAPLFTLAIAWALSLLPGTHIDREPTTILVLIGALLVVLGATLAAVGGSKPIPAQLPGEVRGKALKDGV